MSSLLGLASPAKNVFAVNFTLQVYEFLVGIGKERLPQTSPFKCTISLLGVAKTNDALLLDYCVCVVVYHLCPGLTRSY